MLGRTNARRMPAMIARQIWRCRRHRHSPAFFFSTTTPQGKPAEAADGIFRLLTPDQRSLLEQQRSLTTTTKELARQVGVFAEQEDLPKFLQDYSLETTFSIVVAGEFNAGKSTLINALLGQKLLDSGVLPTTDTITIVSSHQHAQSNQKKETPPLLPSGVAFYSLPQHPLLQDLTIVDTPGTNAVLSDHTARTLRLLPAADLILFVTSAERPFPESERTLLQTIQDKYRRNIVIVINKMDILDAAGGDHGGVAKQQVLDFVTDHAQDLLGARPIVLPVSARDALTVKLLGQKSANNDENDDDKSLGSTWKRSNFGALEDFLHRSLTAESKLKSKLISPIGLALGIVSQCRVHLEDERKDLEADVATLNLVTNQWEGWKRELKSELQTTKHEMLSLIDKHKLEEQTSLANRLKLWDSLVSVDQSETKSESVTSSLHKELIEIGNETAESIATQGRAQGQVLIEYLGARPSTRNQSLVGSVTSVSRFEDTRKALADNYIAAVESVSSIQDGDSIAEMSVASKRLAWVVASAESAGILCSLAGLLGVVDLVVAIPSGLTLAIGGGSAWWVGKSRLLTSQALKWDALHQSLETTLDSMTHRQAEKVSRRIFEGILPYTRFVETEQERVDRLLDECDSLSLELRQLQKKIQQSM